ncbi:hypothetical protein PoB_003203200 [Plakobranchus ocellatus]|uniref:Uncharacterized protein n=1 Tax=Plakobranchus ocellatus TaxID=259542 RepID=A0AAV4AE64_9GAST|nr:hypothetical protein PoB_003203200 [Plakobranchus ocellatus]
MGSILNDQRHHRKHRHSQSERVSEGQLSKVTKTEGHHVLTRVQNTQSADVLTLTDEPFNSSKKFLVFPSKDESRQRNGFETRRSGVSFTSDRNNLKTFHSSHLPTQTDEGDSIASTKTVKGSSNKYPQQAYHSHPSHLLLGKNSVGFSQTVQSEVRLPNEQPTLLGVSKLSKDSDDMIMHHLSLQRGDYRPSSGRGSNGGLLDKPAQSFPEGVWSSRAKDHSPAHPVPALSSDQVHGDRCQPGCVEGAECVHLKHKSIWKCMCSGQLKSPHPETGCDQQARGEFR